MADNQYDLDSFDQGMKQYDMSAFDQGVASHGAGSSVPSGQASPTESAPPTYTSDKNEFTPMESFGKGVQQGTTMGFADELGALAGLAGAKVGGDKRPIGDVYKEIRNLLRQEYAGAQEENPLASLGGNIAGGILTPGMGAAKAATGAKELGALAKAVNMGKIGAKAGAIGGLGTSEADLASGKGEDAQKALQDTVSGGALGFGLGAGGQAIGSGIKGLGKFAKETIAEMPIVQDMGKVFKKTMKGTELLGKTKELADVNRGQAEDIIETLGNARKAAGQQIDKALTQLDDDAVVLDFSPSLENVNRVISEADPNDQQRIIFLNKVKKLFTKTNQAKQGELSDAAGALAEMGAPKEQIKQELMDQPFLRKPSEVIKLRQDLNKLMSSATDAEDYQLLNSLRNELMDTVEQEAEKVGSAGLGALKEGNKNYRFVDTAQSYLGLPPFFNAADTRGKIQASGRLTNTLRKTLDEGSTQAQNVEKGLETLSKVDTDLSTALPKGMTPPPLIEGAPQGKDVAGFLKGQIKENVENENLARQMSKESTLSGNIKTGYSTPKAFLLNASRGVGKMARPIADTAEQASKRIAETGRALYDMSPDEIKQIGSGMSAIYKQILEKAADAPDSKRKALLFSLMQQPGFRAAYQGMPVIGSDNNQSDEEPVK